MTQETIIELDNHLQKCRCCLREFDEEDTQVKITKIIRERFLHLTQVELKPAEIYSHVICESCNNELRSFSNFRKDLIFKQLSLMQFVEGIEEIAPEPDLEQPSLEPENVKHDTKDVFMEVKTEEFEVEPAQPNALSDDFTNFVSAEYLVSLPEDATIECVESEEFCGIEAERSENYTLHVVNAAVGKKFYKRALCGLCGKNYYKDQLQRHIDKVHYKVKRFFCDICGFGSFLKCNLQTHMGKHIAKEFREQIKCELCNATFTRHESLKNHTKTEHQTPVMLKCFCGKEFNLRHKLTTHIKRTHNNVRNHQCSLCEKKFFTPKELKVHVLKIHTPGYVDKSEHFCEICGKKYSSSKSLKTHMKHHSDPQFKCHFEGCQKAFITRLLLTNHEKTHTGQRDFMCHLCEKSFFSANHLRRHIVVSHDKVKVNCFVEGCPFSVGRKDYLRNHMMTHRELAEDVKNAYLVKIREMKF